MKKYNLKKIMKRAWEIKKENKKNLFAMCLKMAWEEAKMEEKKLIDINELPALTGTEKQIKWANDIREKMIVKTDEFIKSLSSEIESKNGYEAWRQQKLKFVALVAKTKVQMLEEESAAFWIDKRYSDVETYFKEKRDVIGKYEDDKRIEWFNAKHKEGVDVELLNANIKNDFISRVNVYLSNDKRYIAKIDNEELKETAKKLHNVLAVQLKNEIEKLEAGIGNAKSYSLYKIVKKTYKLY